MNAKELFELYRPLHSKVPGTKPPFLFEDDYGDGGGRHMIFAEELSPFDEQRTADTNAALCRVAVEDWLCAKCHIVELEMGRGGYSSVYIPSMVETPFGSTESVHHALVAAALAVAGSKA